MLGGKLRGKERKGKKKRKMLLLWNQLQSHSKQGFQAQVCCFFFLVLSSCFLLVFFFFSSSSSFFFFFLLFSSFFALFE